MIIYYIYMDNEYKYKELFNKLDEFIDIHFPKQKIIYKCCNNRDIQLSQSLLLFVCVSCGVVTDTPFTKDFYDRYKNPLFIKTLIPYRPKTRHLTRLSKWANYSYKEVVLTNNLEYINSKLGHLDRDVLLFSKVLFKQIFPNMKIRAKIKDALIIYCYYSTSMVCNKEIEIDELLNIFNISIKNYNDLVFKLDDNKLYYYENLNEYLEITDLYSQKNKIIKLYNLFLTNTSKRFMKKSIILGIIYKLVKDENIKKKFFKLFDINKSSIKNITKYINEYKII